MKKIISSLLAVAFCGVSGCASQGDLKQAKIQLHTMEERLTAADNRMAAIEETKRTQKVFEDRKVCYADNLAYSEGSIRNGRICERGADGIVENGKMQPAPLVWQAWKYQK